MKPGLLRLALAAFSLGALWSFRAEAGLDAPLAFHEFVCPSGSQGKDIPVYLSADDEPWRTYLYAPVLIFESSSERPFVPRTSVIESDLRGQTKIQLYLRLRDPDVEACIRQRGVRRLGIPAEEVGAEVIPMMALRAEFRGDDPSRDWRIAVVRARDPEAAVLEITVPTDRLNYALRRIESGARVLFSWDVNVERIAGALERKSVWPLLDGVRVMRSGCLRHTLRDLEPSRW